MWSTKGGTSVNSYFLFESSRKAVTIFLKNELFCVEQRKNKISTYIPLDPQPNPESVVMVHRYYATLKMDGKYRKRVTAIISPIFPKVAVWEYSGTYLDSKSFHGNDKRKLIEYSRTDPRVMKEIGEKLVTKPPRAVYQEMLDDSFKSPRDFKQVRDKKYKDSKIGQKVHSCNVADDLMTVFSMVDENPHVQEVIHTKNKPPCVILYSDEQLLDMRYNILEGSVLGVDRTFNLGPCFVTVTVYKNCAVHHKESGKNPIFLGPCYLHWDGKFETYQPFFSHIQKKMIDAIPEFNLKLGSDQEAAILKALKLVFPKATHILCAFHLKENVTRHLRDVVGCSTKERHNIIDSIFGENGIIHCSDSFTFDEKVIEIGSSIIKYPKFARYFDKLKPLIYSYVCLPSTENNGSIWTNNNCESMNNILKLTNNWKPQKLPALIQNLTCVTKLHMADLRRALHGTGNYLLVPKKRKYLIPRELWFSKTETEKQTIFLNFLKRDKVKAEDRITSTDTKYSIPQTPSVAKKPCQRKRPRSERTN